MTSPRKDIDPTVDLTGEEDEQSLPELEQDSGVDLAAPLGSLPAGRAAILRYA